MDEMMREIERDGKPHTAVGCGVEVIVRSGVGTAYPHTNQFHHNRVKRGDALQVVCIPSVGGYNGEQYRSYQIAPWDSHRERVWEVHTESCLIQARESKAGVRCRDVARAVHEFQVKSGMSRYIYHRPAHGQGIEGHQPPYIALGDETVLEAGMMFSNEPGLYDPENGFGYNHSDNVLVTATKGVQMGSAPLTKDWCFLKL
jgi:Xaa-Pro aminopeptidase